MPLHVARLRDSDLAAEASPEACWYAVLLWAASWHQLPAGSLPDNDAILAKLIGLGRDVRTFRKHKAGAMRGFVLCDDGRLYHPVVAEQVIDSWNRKLQQRWRTECARIKKANQRAKDAGLTESPTPTLEEFLSSVQVDPRPQSVPEDTANCPPGQSLQGTGTGTGTSKEDATASPVGLFGDEAVEQVAPKAKPWEDDAGFLAVWNAATPAMRSRAKSREKTWPEWAAARRTSAPGRILVGMQRYLAGDPDVARTGGPGLHIWLRDRTFELWVGEAVASSAPSRFAGPAALRDAILALPDGQQIVEAYLDQSGWRDLPDPAVLARTRFAADKLLKAAASIFADFGATVVVEAAPFQPDLRTA